jgi:hypothetical protein
MRGEDSLLRPQALWFTAGTITAADLKSILEFERRPSQRRPSQRRPCQQRPCQRRPCPLPRPAPTCSWDRGLRSQYCAGQASHDQKAAAGRGQPQETPPRHEGKKAAASRPHAGVHAAQRPPAGKDRGEERRVNVDLFRTASVGGRGGPPCYALLGRENEREIPGFAAGRSLSSLLQPATEVDSQALIKTPMTAPQRPVPAPAFPSIQQMLPMHPRAESQTRILPKQQLAI